MARIKKIDKEIKFQPNQIVYVIYGYYLEDFEIYKTKVKDILNNGIIWYKLESGDRKRNVDFIFGTLEEAYACICEMNNANIHRIDRNYKQLKRKVKNNEI